MNDAKKARKKKIAANIYISYDANMQHFLINTPVNKMDSTLNLI